MRLRNLWRYVRYLFIRRGVIYARFVDAETERFAGEQAMRDSMCDPLRDCLAELQRGFREIEAAQKAVKKDDPIMQHGFSVGGTPILSTWGPSGSGRFIPANVTAINPAYYGITPEKIEAYQTREGRYKWRVRSAEGIVYRVSPLTYSRRWDAMRGAKRALGASV